MKALETILVIRDAAVRLEALKRVDALAPLLAEEFINRKLFDALLLGFGDANDDARLLTLMAMLAIAPRLSEKNKTDRLLRVVKRLEADRSAKIRTNVVIFYGRLAPDLSEALRHKVALPAFCKALDDGVPFVRLAAVRALGACRDCFSAPVVRGASGSRFGSRRQEDAAKTVSAPLLEFGRARRPRASSRPSSCLSR